MKKLLVTLAFCVTIIVGCKDDTATTTTTENPVYKNAPAFNADTAYNYVTKQLAFGPRVPGTTAQKNCAVWMQGLLKQYCDSVYVQNAMVTQPVSNKTYPCINIIGAINPQAQSRVLLLCHWDSRPFADNDPNKANHTKAIDAADDGASGVAVLLEIARAIKAQKLDIGVDILLADVEDVGKSDLEKEGQIESTYCLGSRYWAKNPHIYGYRANYGICLDMVGARGATFRLEGFSKQLAPDVQRKVWDIAAYKGHTSYFLNVDMGGITDDHMEINQFARIPCIDIIGTNDTGFGNHWHTIGDNISVIDKGTLKAVGETVLGVLYNY